MEVNDQYGNYSQGRKCSGCGVPVTNISRTGKCRSCYYGPERTCSECGDPIPRKSRTGKCGSCYRKGFKPVPGPLKYKKSYGNYSKGRTCSECGDLIPNQGKTGKCRSCFNKWRSGPNHHNWKGGSTNGNGYRVVYGNKGHPNSRGTRGEILEHILVMSEHLGRPLITRTETVHHKNGDRSDNRLSNLELWSSAQPAGQRVIDKVQYARGILALYAAQVDQGIIN